MTGPADTVDGFLVLCVIVTLLIVAAALSGAMAVAYQRVDAWLDRKLAERRQAAREALADPVLAARRGQSTRLARSYAPNRIEGER